MKRVLAAEDVLSVRDALMEAMAFASRDGDRDAWRACQRALAAVGYVGSRPVTLDLHLHGQTLLAALNRRAGLHRETMDVALSEPERRQAHMRMLAAETAIARLRLDKLSPEPQPRPDHRRAVTIATLRRASRR